MPNDDWVATGEYPALAAMRQSLKDALRLQTVAKLLSRRALRSVYQPIVSLANGQILAHEALIRGPVGTELVNPDALFAAAAAEGLTLELEQACIATVARYWSPPVNDQRLFVNLSAETILHQAGRQSVSGIVSALEAAQVSPAVLVIEVTEHERVTDVARLVAVADELRALGLRFALDDFGEGHSNLRLWSELRPEFVKIDKYFVRQIDLHAKKVQTIKGLARLAEVFGSRLVAEGVETDLELRIVRDLGIELGQGYFLGRPQPEPVAGVLPEAAAVLSSAVIAVLPEITRAAGAELTVRRLALHVPPLPMQATNDEVAQAFAEDPARRAVALVDGTRPVGLISRQAFVDRYAKPFHRELYARKPAMAFANSTPLMLDQHTGIEGLTAVLTSSDQRYLTDGFILTDAGRYMGLGTGEQLVRMVTEVRIEAARHANPLTFLPGNIPTTEHIDRLMGSGSSFVACYCDLNDFKPYNDHYGYWRGDEMIQLVARTLIANCDARRDFVGHVGGDDFIVLFQSDDWLARCERVVETFNALALELFDEDARERGGIEAEDRHGVNRFFGFTTLSIGAVPVRRGRFDRADQVASAAAAAKHKAKASRIGLAVEAP
ncbi:MAG: EAL domain-containing protein [bacterium]|jgi:diguanylate cyclase (GGDEF)-like protein|nr:EAL domain-containing protein [Betaproteobacteria bacterium]